MIPELKMWSYDDHLRARQGMHSAITLAPASVHEARNAVLYKIDLMTSAIENWRYSENDQDRDALFDYDRSVERWTCALCKKNVTGWANHLTASHFDVLVRFLGFRLDWEDWQALDEWANCLPTLRPFTDGLNYDANFGIKNTIANNLRFYKGVAAIITNMPFKELRDLALEDNKCKGCGEQVKHLRDHLIANHLHEMGFAAPEKRMISATAQEKQRQRITEMIEREERYARLKQRTTSSWDNYYTTTWGTT